jgi:hypothetical protein
MFRRRWRFDVPLKSGKVHWFHTHGSTAAPENQENLLKSTSCENIDPHIFFVHALVCAMISD